MAATRSTPEQFRAAEQALARTLDVDLTERMLETHGPVRNVRVIECGDGTPVLLVHGGGGLASQMLPLMARIEGHRSIAVDCPGCGLTDRFEYPAGASLRALGLAFMESVVDALGIEQVDIVASSMGALWSLWFALAHPERVRSLAVVGCPALVVGTSTPLPLRVMTRWPFHALLRRPSEPDALARLMKIIGHDIDVVETQSPGFLALSTAAGNLPGAGASLVSLLRCAVRLRGARPESALADDELAELQVRPLAVWGTNDPFGSAADARRFAAVAKAELVTAGTGHGPWLDDPAGVAAHVNAHLARVAAPAPTAAPTLSTVRPVFDA